jgi:hypothetical protein
MATECAANRSGPYTRAARSRSAHLRVVAAVAVVDGFHAVESYLLILLLAQARGPIGPRCRGLRIFSADRSGDQHEPGQQRRVSLGQVHGHHSAEGMPDHHAAGRDLLGHLVDERVEVCHGRQIEGRRAQPVGQGVDDRRPRLRVTVQARKEH